MDKSLYNRKQTHSSGSEDAELVGFLGVTDFMKRILTGFYSSPPSHFLTSKSEEGEKSETDDIIYNNLDTLVDDICSFSSEGNGKAEVDCCCDIVEDLLNYMEGSPSTQFLESLEERSSIDENFLNQDSLKKREIPPAADLPARTKSNCHSKRKRRQNNRRRVYRKKRPNKTSLTSSTTRNKSTIKKLLKKYNISKELSIGLVRLTKKEIFDLKKVSVDIVRLTEKEIFESTSFKETAGLPMQGGYTTLETFEF